MHASIEQRVSSALMQWRFFERALHSQATWTMTYAGVTVPADRTVTPEGVSFLAEFPALCPIAPGEPVVALAEDGEVVQAVVLAEPLDECGATVQHDVLLPAPITA